MFRMLRPEVFLRSTLGTRNHNSRATSKGQVFSNEALPLVSRGRCGLPAILRQTPKNH